MGEITARGADIMQGYYRDPELTRQTIRNGWIHSGDMAKVDEEGFIYIVDRKTEMIISGGFNVYPQRSSRSSINTRLSWRSVSWVYPMKNGVKRSKRSSS